MEVGKRKETVMIDGCFQFNNVVCGGNVSCMGGKYMTTSVFIYKLFL